VPTNNPNTSATGTNPVLKQGAADGSPTAAQRAGLRPPVPGEKPPKKH